MSAGTINSPQLLLLSGIGPKTHLNANGIKCRVDLPVGQNLQDHVGTVLGPMLINESHSLIPDRNISLSALTDYMYNGTGPLAFLPVSVTGKISSSFAHPSWPDLFVHQAAIAPHTGSGPFIRVLEDALGFQQNFLSTFTEGSEGKDAFYNALSLGRPYSRGQLTLRSSDPFDKPLIDPKYYSDPRDAEIMIEGMLCELENHKIRARIWICSFEGIQKLLRIYEDSSIFKNLNATLANGPVEGCDKYGVGSKKYWDCFIRTFTVTIWHPCCTCPMKSHNISANDGVVDSKLR